MLHIEKTKNRKSLSSKLCEVRKGHQKNKSVYSHTNCAHFFLGWHTISKFCYHVYSCIEFVSSHIELLFGQRELHIFNNMNYKC